MMAGLGRVGGEGMRGEVVGREFAGWREKEHTRIWGEKKSSNSEARWIQSRKKKRKIDQVDGPVEKRYGGGRSVCKYVTVQGDAVREDGGHSQKKSDRRYRGRGSKAMGWAVSNGKIPHSRASAPC